MRIAILGAGNVGGALARRLAACGHSVALAFARAGQANRGRPRRRGRGRRTEAAVAGAELVILATPWAATEAALGAATMRRRGPWSPA